MQLDEEFKEMKNILSEIENIKKRTEDINEFLKNKVHIQLRSYSKFRQIN